MQIISICWLHKQVSLKIVLCFKRAHAWHYQRHEAEEILAPP